jgi:hypothetical protein
MLDDARVDVKIVVANNVSSPNTPNHLHVVRFRVQSGILGKYLLFFSFDQVAHCFSSRPPNRDLRLLEHELGRNSNFIVHED